MTNLRDINKLDNYQLYQLKENQDLPYSFRLELDKELEKRKPSEEEIILLKQKYVIENGTLNPISDKKKYPVFTAIRLSFHWKEINKLRRNGLYKKARIYEFELYLGIVLYLFIFVLCGGYTLNIFPFFF